MAVEQGVATKNQPTEGNPMRGVGRARRGWLTPNRGLTLCEPVHEVMRFVHCSLRPEQVYRHCMRRSLMIDPEIISFQQSC